MPSPRLPDTMLPILLAGGEGVRLRPITADLPKPLIPVDGVPAICRILDTLASLGADRAVITVRYRADDIIRLLGESYAGIRLFYSREEQPRGTAGGVRDAWDRYAADSDTDALIISGDAVFTCDLAAFSAFHRDIGASASLLCVRVPDPGAFGTVISDSTGRITAFSEKPCAAETLSDTASCGIYCMSRAFLEQIPTDGTPDFGTDILPQALLAGDALYAFESPDYWCDIGSFADYLACSTDISAGRIPGVVTPRSRMILPPYITDSSVGRECFIPASASVRKSILFDRVVIGTGATVTDSILCEGVHIGDGAVIEPGCVIGRRCKIGEKCRLPRGTKLPPETELPSEDSAVRNAFESGTVPAQYLSDLGYALSAGTLPVPETAVIFARALAAFAKKSESALFLCHVEDTPEVRCLEALVCESLCCIPTAPDQPSISRADGVLPLSAARMPHLPIPDRQHGQTVFRVVFLRRGGILRAVLFDDAGLHPTRQVERLLDACLSEAHSAGPRATASLPEIAEPTFIRSIPSAELLAVYVARYAVCRLQSPNGTPFSFSCGSTPEERLLAALLCAMGGQERLQASVHFSIPLPSEDCGDILCPLTVSDLRTNPVGTYSHWTMLSLLAGNRHSSKTAVLAFPTTRTSHPTDVPIPLSLPLCAPEEIPADFRYASTPSITSSAKEPTPAALARMYAAAEAEDAVLLARDIAVLCSQTTRPIAALLQTVEQPIPSFRRHGFAQNRTNPNDPLTLRPSLSALTEDAGDGAFRPAVEGVMLRRDDGCVRIVATRDHNYRIIADAYSTEAAEALFRLAQNRLLYPGMEQERS